MIFMINNKINPHVDRASGTKDCVDKSDDGDGGQILLFN